MPEKPARLSFLLVAVIGIIFITYFSAEAALRILAPVFPPSLRIFIQEESKGFGKSSLRVSHGCQIILEDDFSTEKFDLIAVGDSMVFGTLVDKDDTFTALLNKRTGLKVLNLGIPGWGICAYNRMVNYALANLKNKPSLVLYFIFADDLVETRCPSISNSELFIKENDYRSNIGLKIRAVREKVFGRSILYQLLKRLLTFRHLHAGQYYKPVYCKNNHFEFLFAAPEFWGVYLDSNRGSVKEGLANALVQTRAARDMAMRSGTNFIVILVPFKEQIYLPILINEGLLPDSVYASFYNTTYDRLRSSIEGIGIQVWDLRSAFSREAKRNVKLFWALDGHFTPVGHKLVASELATSLKEQLKDFNVKRDIFGNPERMNNVIN